MPKFFVKSEQIKENKIEIVGQDVEHIRKVLRYTTGQELEICNQETGITYVTVIEEIMEKAILCKIQKETDYKTEANVYIHILQGIPKADKMEWIIEKCTEIGVTEFTPVRMKYCIAKIEGKDEQKKIIRWRKIAEAAAKQSRRDQIPKINSIINLKNVYEILEKYDIVLVAYEQEKEVTLKEVLKNNGQKQPMKIAVLIGPEGGIAQEEVQLLQTYGMVPITLGKRILRTETAPMVIASNLIYELEN